MIEILYFGLSANRGGIETYLRKIEQRLNRNAFHLNYIDMTGEGEKICFYDELKADGCSIYKITPRNVSIKQNREEIKRLFKENHFDIFHFNVNTLSYVFPMNVALDNGCKVLIHSRSSYATNWKTRMLHSINKQMLHNKHITKIAISKAAGEWMFGKNDFKVYPNGVDTERFTFDEIKREKIRIELGCENRVVLGNAAAFLPVKNHVFLVELMRELVRRDNRFVLWLAGDGPLREEIEQQVRGQGLESQVYFLGNREDMETVYSGMDIFLFPSLFEGLGNVLLEAECSGLPCIASSRVPIDTLVAEKTCSLDTDSVGVWCDTILEYASSLERTNGIKAVLEAGFSVTDEIERLVKLYKQMLVEN